MKPLSKHNSEKLLFWQTLNKPRLNGLSCPKCEYELIDIEPQIILMTDPPQTKIKCSNCNFEGHRFI